MPANDFARRVLHWQKRFGRKDLPWQRNPTPYAVWISEIMLQQTRVETVIRYFERFLLRFPSVDALAYAELDQVLHLWSGLGYYARARNLHRTARIVMDECGGTFPQSLEELTALPGIGRSTAGAILSLGMGQRATILDGNVRRLLARHEGIDGWTGSAAVQTKLWEVAGRYTPDRRAVARYNQAMMDLGATICTPTSPQCDTCPVADDCVALATDRVLSLPSPRPKRELPVRSVRVAVIRNPRGEILLQRRPPTGIWGGLWSFPEMDDAHVARLLALSGVSERQLRAGAEGAAVRHTFTHFHLDITPVHVQLARAAVGTEEPDRWVWFDPDAPAELGIAAPVARMIASLRGS